MRLVYERADRVVIWLGNEREESAIAMDLMRRVADILDPMTMMLIGAASESMIYRCVKLIVANFGSWDAVLLLLLRPWWKRAWVLQEVVVSRESFGGVWRQGALVG